MEIDQMQNKTEGHRYVGDVCFKEELPMRGGKKRLLLDFALPDASVWPGPWPVILLVHGGTWIGWRMREDFPWHLVDDHGFALVRFDYRTAYEAPFPAQVADCRSAVRYVRKNASEYNIDPSRIGVKGVSSGGQLASMLGVGDGAEGIDNKDEDLTVPVAVQAVVDDFGPSDILGLWKLMNLVHRYLSLNPFSGERTKLMEEMRNDPNFQAFSGLLESLLGKVGSSLTFLPGVLDILEGIKADWNFINAAKYLSGWENGTAPILKDEALLRRMSPIEYVTGSLRKEGSRIPPFRILHGPEDGFVPFHQSQTFADELRKAGIEVEFDINCGGGGHFPSGEHWNNVILPKEIAFFKRIFRMG